MHPTALTKDQSLQSILRVRSTVLRQRTVKVTVTTIQKGVAAVPVQVMMGVLKSGAT